MKKSKIISLFAALFLCASLTSCNNEYKKVTKSIKKLLRNVNLLEPIKNGLILLRMKKVKMVIHLQLPLEEMETGSLMESILELKLKAIKAKKVNLVKTVEVLLQSH